MHACHSERSPAKRRICLRRLAEGAMCALTGAMLLVLNGCGGGPTAADGPPPPPPPSVTVSYVSVYYGLSSPLDLPYAIAGQGSFQLLVAGTGFTQSSVVNWNGSALPTNCGCGAGTYTNTTASV